MLSSLVLCVASAFAQDSTAESPLLGIYQGALDVGGASLRLALHVEPKEGGGFVVKLDSLDQGALGMPASKAEVEGRQMHLEWRPMSIAMECELASGDQWIDVKFAQGPVKSTLMMKRVLEVEMPKRPQEPKPPFPYVCEDVTFESVNEDVELAGTLTLPQGDGPFAAVVLVSGSGPQDRNEELLGHKPFLVLSDYLTRHGIAVLRYDDRGTAQSTGNFGAATSFDFTDDALGAVAFLKTHTRIDPKRIGIAGHSEGGMIAPIAANRSQDVAFIVLLAGPGIPGDELLALQSALIAKAGGASDDEVARTTAMNQRLYALVQSEPIGPQLSGKLLAVVEEAKKAAKSDAEREEYTAGALAIGQIATPWFKTFLTYDPRTELRKVKCPVLALNGEKDLQVPPREDLDAIGAALKEAGNERVTIREFPGLNHLFQPCETGSPSEYTVIETTMSEDVLAAVADFVRALP